MEIIVNKAESLLPKTKISIPGKGQLLHNTFPYYLLACLMLIALAKGMHSGFLLIFIAYSLLPLFDEFFSLDLRNPTNEERK